MPPFPDREELREWLGPYDVDDFAALLADAAAAVPGLAEWLQLRRIADGTQDAGELLTAVNQVLTPSRRFYDYRQANEYADEGYNLVQVLSDLATHASPDLVRVIERAITLTTRAILKSDDSSGTQGDLVRTLMDAHATAVRTSTPPLTQAEQSKLVDWILKYRYGGTQDFFDPDIVAYAPALSAKSIDRYRTAIATTDLGEYGYYPLTRLAVLDKDRDAIVAAHRGEPTTEMIAKAIVADLEEAGLHDDAVAYARIGIRLDRRGWDRTLITFLVDDAFARGADADAVQLRRDWFHRYPGSPAFADLRETAKRVGHWDEERVEAERILSDRDPAAFVTHLLGESRDEEAWDFARARRDDLTRLDTWLAVCASRAKTHPADTLPIYEQVITDILTVTDVRNYKSATRILKTMRDVAQSAGPASMASFDQFLARTVEDNRRRPRFLQELARAKLIAGR